MCPFLRRSLAVFVASRLSLAMFVVGCTRAGFTAATDTSAFGDESISTDAAGLSFGDLGVDSPSTLAEHGDAEVRLDAAATPGDLFVSTDATAAPCAVGVTETFRYGQPMVICASTARAVNQCEASQLCNRDQGWHLCSASEFLTHGGATTASPALSDAWIASCVRTDRTVHAPTDQVCLSCAAANVSYAETAWTCSGPLGTQSTPWSYAGVTTSSLCGRVGINDRVYAAFWTSRVSGSPVLPKRVAAAVCCR